MTVKEILQTWLKDNGYDGLYHPGDCGCSIEDLITCDDDCSNCEPGYKHIVNNDSDVDIMYCGIKEITETEDGHCITCWTGCVMWEEKEEK